MFTQEDVKNFSIDFPFGKEKGFTLEGAKNKLKTQPKNTIENHEIITRLEAVKAELLKIKNEL